MAKPTTEELETALIEAKRMREQDDDPCHIAKALLNLHYQNRYLQKVLDAVDHYFHSGQADREHTLLLKAVEEAHRADDRSAGIERDDLGLA